MGRATPFAALVLEEVLNRTTCHSLHDGRSSTAGSGASGIRKASVPDAKAMRGLLELVRKYADLALSAVDASVIAVAERRSDFDGATAGERLY